MINLKVFKENVTDNNELYPVFNISLINKINFIIGLSGSGKSYFVRALREALDSEYGIWTMECDLPVIVMPDSGINVSDILSIINNNKNTLIVCDEATVLFMRKKQLMGKLKQSKNYFLMCDRTSIIREDVNINSVFEFKYRKFNGSKVFDTVKTFNMKENNDLDIDFVVTEDSESGLLFWTNVFSKVRIPKFKRHGNGEVVKQIKYLLKKYDGNILVILDYDHGAIMMRKLLMNKRIDKTKLYFMPLESFEEVVCNSEFILSKFPELKELVVNYNEYIDCNYTSTGNYFSSLLFNIVKVKSPIKQHGDRNYTKFYEKGMKNFKECFIDNCCAYGILKCKLYCEGDKKKAMLANKFEIYRKFI